MSNKKYKSMNQSIKKLIDTKMGCLATDKITVEGRKVGFMYREKTDGKFPDTGWRFFAGDETEEYISNLNNSAVFQLNTICNYNPEIIPFLDSEYGTAYYRDEQGNFQIDKEWCKHK